MPKRDVATCDDGTEIDFEWVYDGAEQGSWLLEDTHFSDPLTPMDVWIGENGRPGIDRAWSDVSLEPSPPLYRGQYVGPFYYLRTSPWEPERQERFVASAMTALDRFGTIAQMWTTACEPTIRSIIDDIRAAPTTDSLVSIAERRAYGYYQTLTPIALLMVAGPRFAEFLGEFFDGPDAALLADEVRQGGQNSSQDIDAEVDQVGAIARTDESLLRLVAGQPAAVALETLRVTPSARQFVTSLDALVAKHAERSFRWDLAAPTWGEAPEAVLAMVLAHARTPGDPAASAAASLARRDAARERVLSALPAAAQPEFQRWLHVFEDYVGMREGRAYLQMTLMGVTRLHLLGRGTALVADGHLERADDVLFVLPPEYEESVASDLAERASARRAEWEQWREVTPPTFVGLAPLPVAVGPRGDVLRGIAASRGTVTGRARIVGTPEEGAFMEDGEILICKLTTPAWTPVLALAAGLVTETGGPNSHPSIVAREYGIPCVVGLKGATTAIADGAVVTVNGTSGEVTVER